VRNDKTPLRERNGIGSASPAKRRREGKKILKNIASGAVFIPLRIKTWLSHFRKRGLKGFWVDREEKKTDNAWSKPTQEPRNSIDTGLGKSDQYKKRN